jgi:hypothetical protein
MVHRTPYYISFLLVFLIFVSIFLVQFDRVFDVMLQTISSHRGEAASPPLQRCSAAKKQLNSQTCSSTLCPAVTDAALEVARELMISSSG